jgi:hypothetical protein
MSAWSEERRRSDLTGSMASFEILGMIRGIVYVDSHDLFQRADLSKVFVQLRWKRRAYPSSFCNKGPSAL